MPESVDKVTYIRSTRRNNIWPEIKIESMFIFPIAFNFPFRVYVCVWFFFKYSLLSVRWITVTLYVDYTPPSSPSSSSLSLSPRDAFVFEYKKNSTSKWNFLFVKDIEFSQCISCRFSLSPISSNRHSNIFSIFCSFIFMICSSRKFTLKYHTHSNTLTIHKKERKKNMNFFFGVIFIYTHTLFWSHNAFCTQKYLTKDAHANARFLFKFVFSFSLNNCTRLWTLKIGIFHLKIITFFLLFSL